MGFGKVGYGKERMCSYKHTHNGAVHIILFITALHEGVHVGEIAKKGRFFSLIRGERGKKFEKKAFGVVFDGNNATEFKNDNLQFFQQVIEILYQGKAGDLPEAEPQMNSTPVNSLDIDNETVNET